MRTIRTDLAIEAREAVEDGAKAGELSGVISQQEQHGDVIVTRVKITSPEGEKALQKAQGNYITVEIPGLRKNASALFEQGCAQLSKEIRDILALNKDDCVLVAGLGNRFVTPDALGPKTVENTMITRHLIEFMPEQFGKFRSVCAFAPGVLGVTGIETLDVLKGVIEESKPNAVIVVDSLASRKLSRLASTFQVCDSGISPGSGVGNRRQQIDRGSLGVPVIAIGVPTVVDAATLACDVMDIAKDALSKDVAGLKDVSMEEKYGLVADALTPFEQNLLVTPKEVDMLIDDVAKMLGYSINLALHDNLTLEDINSFLS